jgi:hypothetical protein
MNRAEKITAIKSLLAGQGNITSLRRGLIDFSSVTPEEKGRLEEIAEHNQDLFSKGTPVGISALPDADAKFIYSIHTKEADSK